MIQKRTLCVQNNQLRFNFVGSTVFMENKPYEREKIQLKYGESQWLTWLTYYSTEACFVTFQQSSCPSSNSSCTPRITNQKAGTAVWNKAAGLLTNCQGKLKSISRFKKKKQKYGFLTKKNQMYHFASTYCFLFVELFQVQQLALTHRFFRVSP